MDKKFNPNRKVEKKCKFCGKDIIHTVGSPLRKATVKNLDGTFHTCGTNVKIFTKEEIAQYIKKELNNGK